MKLNQLVSFLKILFILAALTTSSFSLQTSEKAERIKDTPEPTKYSTDPSSSATGKIKAESRVLSAPFKVKSCDQVIEIEGAKTLTDMNDFSIKEDRFFTLSVYMLNEFKKKESNSLFQSLPFEKTEYMPEILEGSVSCVRWIGDSKSINICVENEEKANALILAHKDFMKCRRGEGLSGLSDGAIQRILKSSCLGLDIKADPNLFTDDKKTGETRAQKLEFAISQALLTVSNKLRGTLSTQSNTEQLAKERIGKKK